MTDERLAAAMADPRHNPKLPLPVDLIIMGECPLCGSRGVCGCYANGPVFPSWPADVAVPPRAVKGLRDAPIGTEEGELCLRAHYATTTLCLGKIELRPDASLGGCSCPNGHGPCGSCTSTMPECPACGWRAE